jgi:hypothetical protein
VFGQSYKKSREYEHRSNLDAYDLTCARYIVIHIEETVYEEEGEYLRL